VVSIRRTVHATAPAKAILLGEHAVNRGQAALAISIGLHASCTLFVDQLATETCYRLISDHHCERTTRAAIQAFGQMIDAYRADQHYTAMQLIAADDFFAPAKYVLAALGDNLPPALTIRFASTIPQSAGLGSGGATFVALAAALACWLDRPWNPREIAAWALRGDIIAHGGVASGLDTQTSLYGGAIRYSAEQGGEPIPYAGGLALVFGHSGVIAATSTINNRVRNWLTQRPVRLHYFSEIGLLSRLAQVALRDGDWPELGRLFNLNQLILQQIGVSCPELEKLIDAALTAGAYGAKLSGSGGGGIMIALVAPDRVGAVAQAINAAGGTPIVAPVGVPGVTVRSEIPALERSSSTTGA
jgi:mevalonate kinase